MSEGPQAGHYFPFHRENVYLGRMDDNDLVLNDPLVSRHHALIFFKEGQFFIEDLGSINGTFVNNEEIAAPYPLQDGDTIGLGDVEFLFRVGEYPPAEGLSEASKTWPPGVHLGILALSSILIALTIWFGFLLPQASPSVHVNSPADEGQVVEGDDVLIISTARDREGIARLELWVDGKLYHTLPGQESARQSFFYARQVWKAEGPGRHVLTVKVYNLSGQSRTSAPITVEVIPQP